jgi:phosphotransferase system HPr-like phosphotransfer protein
MEDYMKRKKLNCLNVKFMQDLVRLNSTVAFETTIYQGKYVINGKSVMGIFSLGGLLDAEIEFEEDRFYEDALDSLIQKYT